MVKGGNKSSATSATRKKHAKKATGVGQVEEPIQKKPKRKERGQNKKEPRIKAYIPPVKPAPIQLDPLETTGLVHSLPPELLIILRSFNKKAQVTKIRALEELQLGWVDKCRKEGEDGTSVYILIDMLPVWLHHVPALFVHHSRRVRLLTAGIHTSLLQIPPVRDQILIFIREIAPQSQVESVLGTWCMAAHDMDRSVATMALKSWDSVISTDTAPDQHIHLLLDERLSSSLIMFTQRAALDPNGVYLYLNPVPPAPVHPPAKEKVRKEDSEQTVRSKAEELEENEYDRRARLRVSAFGAIRRILETTQKGLSDELIDFFKNPTLWGSLYHGDQCPFVESEIFGFGQPNVRKAGWALVHTLLRSWKEHLESLLPVVSPAILRSAWVEPDIAVHTTMWQPLLTFLKEFPDAWEIEKAQDYKDGGVDSDSVGSDLEEENQVAASTSISMKGISIAYQEFLHFLELGCSASPLQGYPTVVIIVSTIPSPVLASLGSPVPITKLFDSFWKVLDGRVLTSLQSSATSAAFLSALLECMLFLIKRIRNDPRNHGMLLGSISTVTEADEAIRSLLCGQVIKVWTQLVGKNLRVEQRAAARLIAQNLLSVNDIDEGLFSAAWDAISIELKGAIESHPILVSVFLKVFQDRFKHIATLHNVVTLVTSDILSISIKNCEESLNSKQTSDATVHKSMVLLVEMLDQFREGLFNDLQFSESMDRIVAQYAFSLLNVSSPLLLAYLTHRKNEKQCLQGWRTLLHGIAQHPETVESSIQPLLDATQKGLLPRYLRPSNGEIDVLVNDLLSRALTGDSSYISFVRQVLQWPDYFLSEAGYNSLLDTVVSAFTSQVDLSLVDTEVSILTFESSLGLVVSLFHHPPRTLPRGDFDALMPDIFIFAYVLPKCYDSDRDNHLFVVAGDLWDQWLKLCGDTRKVNTLAQIKTKLKMLLCDTQVRPSSHDIIHVISEAPADLGFNVLEDILPARKEIDEMLNQLPSNPIHPSLSVVDPLIPPASTFTTKHTATYLYDQQGFSAYARVIFALLLALAEDRQAAKKDIWALRHFHALEIYAQDFQRVPFAQSPVFESVALSVGLDTIVSKVEQITTYILTSPTDGSWRRAALSAVMEKKTAENLGALSLFLVDVINTSQGSDLTRDSRILRNILRHTFHDVDKDEADLWIVLARKLEFNAPQTFMAIVSAVTEFAPEPPRLDRLRNELAAALLGIPPSRANTEGLITLRKLAASAPNLDSEVIFLPQPRAVNVMKACEQWIASDEDISEEIESHMALVFIYLAPILQDIPGAHWGLIFDVIENNIENSSLLDDDTLGVLARSLKVTILIQDLASTNKSLRSAWEERKIPILTMIRDLATVPLDNVRHSAPLSACRALVLSVIQSLPQSLIDHETLPKMSHLILDSSTEVQKIAYLFLQSAAQRRTEYLVIETGVDTEGVIKAGLPMEILDILQRDISADLSDFGENDIFGYLLGWMLLFDLFQDASLKVRSSYIEQLRNLDVIASHFIPIVLRLLLLDQGPLKVFKLDIWAVDEFHIEHYETGHSFSLPLLVAHLYYRALLTVPSLIHSWVLDCKDRQLSSSITSYTSQYFSPVIIQTELAHVKSPESTALLAEENLTIKVANAVNEVVASYLVDEHQLEIKLKIPSDWPLHKIEIKDVKRIGVDENRWRAWILAVQQIIWSHNGRIVDGLNLFKKNVTLHFEGQVECAICYSIISVMDGTLPRKPCKTCKNRFHAGCLYKWFNSSHSSSCPLCRSDIF